jgi:4-amino-4-deoxy-L-arabinose transferase-like glycosyltransferase
MDEISKKWLLLGILAISLLVRVGAVARIDDPENVPRTLAESDSQTYYVLADNLLNGTGYRYSADDLPTAKRTPGYPLFLASVFKLFGRSFNAVRIAQCVLDVASTYLVFVISILIFGSIPVALLASLAYALYPPAIIDVTYIMTETLYTFLLVAFTAAGLMAMRRRRYDLYAVSGILFGLATLTRPGALPLPFVLLAIAAIWRRDMWRGFLILALAFSVTMLPWGLRNKRNTGKFVATSTLVGGNLYKGNHLPTQGAYFMSTDSLLTDKIRAEVANVTEVQRDSILRAEAIEMIRSNKAETASLAIKKIPRLWFNLGYGRAPSKKSLAIAALHCAFLLLGFYGFWKSPGTARHLSIIPIATILVSTVLYLTVAAEVRFVFPLIPLLLPYSAFGFTRLIRRIGFTQWGRTK